MKHRTVVNIKLEMLKHKEECEIKKKLLNYQAMKVCWSERERVEIEDFGDCQRRISDK